MALLLGAALAHPVHALTLTRTLGGMQREPTATEPLEPLVPLAPTEAGLATTWVDLLSDLDQVAGLREAKAQAEASDAVAEQGHIRAWLPRLDASVRGEEQRQRYNGVASRTPGSATSLTATWPVWRPADRAGARAQAASAEQARWQVHVRQQDLARQLSLAYLQAVEAAEHWRLTRLHLASLGTQAQAHEKRLNAGLATVLDLLETRMRQDQGQARADQLLSRVRSGALTLMRLSGRSVALPVGLRSDDTASTRAVLPPLADAIAQALSQHPDVKAAQADVLASEEASRASDAERWQPTLDATAGRTRTRQTQRFEGQSDRQDIRSDSVGLVLNWPLFSSGLQQAKQRENAALLSAAQARLDDIESRLRTELQDAYQRRDQAQRQWVQQQAVLASALATQGAVQKAWLAGLRDTTDLLNANDRVHDARLAHASARIAVMQADTDALALIDQLDAPHVAAWLDRFETTPAPLAPTPP